jgi:heavy metal translocating P-type ATPase
MEGIFQVEEYRFCCQGCKHVFLILCGSSGELPEDFRNTELYRRCVATGVIPGNQSAYARVDQSHPSTNPLSGPEEPALTLKGLVGGMWCPACAWVIEECVKRTTGVVGAKVTFVADTIQVQYLPSLVSPEEISGQVRKLGYLLSTGEERGLQEGRKDLLARLSVSAILTMNIMVMSSFLYLGFIRDLTPAVVAYFSYPILCMATPVVFYGGLPILRKAWAAGRFGAASMETLITVSALSAFFYSLLQLARGSIHLYFDTAAMLVTIVLLGRYVEACARDRVLDETGADTFVPQKVRISGKPSGRWLAADAVIPGMPFIVGPGERIPLDGRVVEGIGSLDQSVLTGEALPVVRGPEDHVMAGSLLMEGRLEVVATRSMGDSFLTQMKDLVNEGLHRKSSQEETADRASRLFAPLVLALVIFTATFLWLSGRPPETILLRCLSMLLIACPCALGIAIPLVKVGAMRSGRRKGVLIRNPEALEGVKSLDYVVFDKTGTVTEGSFALLHVVCSETDEEEVLSLVAPIEAESPHFLAREIRRRVREGAVQWQRASGIEEFEGMGVTGVVGKKVVFAGNRRLVDQCGAQLPGFLEVEAAGRETEGMTVVFFGWDHSAKGFLVFGDPLKKGAKELIQWLRDRGIGTMLLSGDNERTTKAVAESLGIPDFFGQMLPSDKVEVIRGLQNKGHRVGMAGDGVNDSAALARADVGIAMGSYLDILKGASDFVVPSSRMSVITDIFDLSARSTRAARQSLFFAFIYNVVAIPIAAAGLLNPIIAVLAMFAGSLTVIGNALRLVRTDKGLK